MSREAAEQCELMRKLEAKIDAKVDRMLADLEEVHLLVRVMLAVLRRRLERR